MILWKFILTSLLYSFIKKEWSASLGPYLTILFR